MYEKKADSKTADSGERVCNIHLLPPYMTNPEFTNNVLTETFYSTFQKRKIERKKVKKKEERIEQEMKPVKGKNST